jgi:microcystin-dependent protein
MGSPYIGEIRMFAGNFAPVGWAFCDGQLMAISENDVLFQLIGTTYGGDGQQTFALPDLRSRVPIHTGQGPGISNNYIIGQMAGTESVTLTTPQIPIHSHPPVASSAAASATSPANAIWAASDNYYQFAAGTASTPMNNSVVVPTGGNQPHDNMLPFLAVNFIISLFGIFPSQN